MAKERQKSRQLPPVDFMIRHGTIVGFKPFSKINGSAESPTVKSINSSVIMPRNIRELKKYTDFEFQVLARTSASDGQQSAVEAEKTFEDGKKTGLPLL